MDLVEESAEGLSAFEFKWGDGGKARIPAAFTTAYPAARVDIVTRANYDLFLSVGRLGEHAPSPTLMRPRPSALRMRESKEAQP